MSEATYVSFVPRAKRAKLRGILESEDTGEVTWREKRTLFGLLPLALGLGAGAELQKPLALAVIGGLALSTPVTLLVVPGLYAAIKGEK